MLIDLPDVVFLWECVCHALLKFPLVSVVIEQHGIRAEPVTTSTSRLLEIGFDAVGTVDVDYNPHVGLVDTHAKGIRSDDYPGFAFLPGLLPLILHTRIETSMIKRG